MGTLSDAVCLSSSSGELHKSLCATPTFSKKSLGNKQNRYHCLLGFLNFIHKTNFLSEPSTFIFKHAWTLFIKGFNACLKRDVFIHSSFGDHLINRLSAVTFSASSPRTLLWLPCQTKIFRLQRRITMENCNESI